MAIDKVLRTSLTQPQPLTALTDPQWDILIHSAQHMGLLGRMQYLLAEGGLLDGIPEQPKMHLETARIVAENERRIMRWEINRLTRALQNVSGPIVLLKGAAYLITNLPVTNGRISSDIDILVNKKNLAAVETALVEQGWEHTKLDDYDQFYYRRWSHELPPLRHRLRGTVVDVHHTILPPTGRLHPDPEKLLARAVPVEGSCFTVLCPADMVLHSAAHGFQDGDLKQGLRDIVDLHDLLRHFGVEMNFWHQLVERSEELDLARPLYYALRYSRLLLSTPIPETIMERAQRHAPPWPIRWLMDSLVTTVVCHGVEGWHGIAQGFSAWALYIRSHWLRMPPLLLGRHLAHQLLQRSPR